MAPFYIGSNYDLPHYLHNAMPGLTREKHHEVFNYLISKEVISVTDFNKEFHQVIDDITRIIGARAATTLLSCRYTAVATVAFCIGFKIDLARYLEGVMNCLSKKKRGEVFLYLNHKDIISVADFYNMKDQWKDEVYGIIGAEAERRLRACMKTALATGFS
ncbi:uncharacterized protein LOC144132410 isoform X2 [Amblyomma americanum]